MGIGGGGGGNNEAAMARKDEEERQARIRAGTERVNSIFDGRDVGGSALGAGAAYNPNGAYYLEDGTAWRPTAATAAPARGGLAPAGGGGGAAAPAAGIPGLPGLQPRRGATQNEASDNYTAMARSGGPRQAAAAPAQKSEAEQFAEMLASGKLYGDKKRVGGFGEDFFSGRRNAFINYATPELESQYADANKQLTYALARSGNLDSSVRGDKAGELQKLYDTNKQSIADKALSYETQARNSIEDARGNLISTLNATGDAEGAAKSALARSAALSAPVAFDPISQLFANFTGTLGAQAAQERAAVASGGSYVPKYNTGLFGGGGRVSVT